MMRWLCFAIVLLAAPVCAQSVPVIPYESVPNAVRLPSNMYLGEVAGVAVNSKETCFCLFARQHERSGFWRIGIAAFGVRARWPVSP